MSEISGVIKSCNEKERAALIAYLTGCYPDKAKFKKIMIEVDKFADIIEVGIPFSDPLADGPVIQMTSQAVLDAGVTTDDILDEIDSLKGIIKSPIVVMTYFNIAYAYGFDRFVERCAEAGVKGTILPDLPPEESADWLSVLEKNRLDSIFLVAPTSSKERIELAAASSTGFVYCVSVAGVTGARNELPETLPKFIENVKKITDKPVAVGFGVSNPAQVNELSKMADGVIIGSALLKQIDPSKDAEEISRDIENFLSPIYQATKRL
jgi:tryptophan synthase alpha chain